jgi:hypothetical protein
MQGVESVWDGQPQQNASHTKLVLLYTTLHQYLIVDVSNQFHTMKFYEEASALFFSLEKAMWCS